MTLKTDQENSNYTKIEKMKYLTKMKLAVYVHDMNQTRVKTKSQSGINKDLICSVPG